jgi:CDP-glycerol glycerophosphotransferase
MTMKDLGRAISWGLNRFAKIPGNIFSLLTGCLTKVRKGTIMCWSFDFKQYSCNPRYLTEYLLENHPGFDIYWVFRKGVRTDGVDKRIKCVRYRSLQYFLLVNQAEFFITNARTDPYRIFWHKKPEQKYLMLWHGGTALKRIEKDVEDKLGYMYLKKAKADSRACDLMISGCRFQTELLSNKFWYSGEILEKGIPRCDIFFDSARHNEIADKVRKIYSIPKDNRIVLYAPTFRKDRSLSPYSINWDTVIPELKKIFGTGVTVLVRLHPNLIGKVDTGPLVSYDNVKDATSYHDMQELLCISDMLITDYSSSMFDIAMLKRPCILYATDLERYDRGYYFKFEELPFPLARNQEELADHLRRFDMESYTKDIDRFNNEVIGTVENGSASKALTDWMISHSISE